MVTTATIILETSPDPNKISLVHIMGEVDDSNLNQLELVVNPLVKEQAVPNVILNFEGLEFINSKVIGYLASIFTSLKHQNRQLIFACANDAVNDILSLVGLDTIVPNFVTLDEAINSIS